jgi:phospholipase/carboxylesterase
MNMHVPSGPMAGKFAGAALFLLLFIFLAPCARGEKKDVPPMAGFEDIDPLDGHALDFLGLDPEKLRRLAEQSAREKKYVEAAQAYLALVKFNQNDSISLYNLACCYGRLRKADAAVKCLAMAVRAGFRDFALLKRDPDFVPIRDTPEFINVLERVPLWEDLRSEKMFVKTSLLTEMLVKVPEKMDLTRKYPLLVGLHGNGGNAEQILAAMAQGLKKEALILAAPQGAYANFPLLRGRHFSWEIQARDRELWKTADPLAVENLGLAVQALKEKYPVSEVYILGFSQGAAYAFLTGFKYPGLAAGIICVGGTLPETGKEFSILDDKEIAGNEKFRVFIAQGNRDPAFPTGLGAANAEKLRNYGYEVEFLDYDGGHEIPPALLDRIRDWMAKK